MHTVGSNPDGQLRQALRLQLLGLAKCEEERAAAEAARVHYWEPMPLSVSSHRECASALRGLADQMYAAAPAPRGRLATGAVA
jgi:hypothetical protein